MARNLQRCVENLNAQTRLPELVLLTGNEHKTLIKTEKHHATQILSHLVAPRYIIPENHADRLGRAEVFGPGKCYTTSDVLIEYVIQGDPLRVFAFDTVQLGKE